MNANFPFCARCGAQARSADSNFCHACGNILITGKPADELPTNEKKERYLQKDDVLKQQYRIVEQLGEGGMGMVYKAEDIKLNRPVAVKEMRLQGLYGPARIQEAIDGFQREAQMLASLSHHSLPRIYNYFDEGDYWFLVMEFIEGVTLGKYLSNAKGGYLLIDDVIVIGIKLCIVLEYLHTLQPRPIIFRDVKPDNIMFTPDRRIYLIDFGIARLFHTVRLDDERKPDTAPFGTWGYAPPEQCGTSARTTPRSDIYALGATLHELFTGKDPTAKLGFDFDPLDLGAQPGADELEELIMHMVKRTESERPENVGIIKLRLEEIGKLRSQQPVVSQPVVSQPPMPVVAQPPMPVASQPVATPVASQPSIVVPPPDLGVAIPDSERIIQKFILSKQTQPTSGPTTPSSSSQNPTLTLDEVVTNQLRQKTKTTTGPQEPSKPLLPIIMGEREIQCAGRIWSLAWSPDGKCLVTVGDYVQVWDVLSGQLFAPYEGHENEELVEVVAWSPKNQLVASGSWDHTVQVWSADAAKRSRSYRGYVYRGHKDNVRALAWSPNGTLIASAGKDPTIRIWNHLSGAIVHSFSIHKETVTSLVWSPDGRYLASASYDKTVKIIDVTRGNKEAIVSTFQGHTDVVYSVSWSPDSRHLASSAADGSVMVWIPSSKGDIVFRYPGHTAGVYTITWSPDSKHLATSSMDKSVQIWDAFSGNLIGGDYAIDTDHLMGLSWRPTGEYIAFGDSDLLHIKYVG